MNTRDPSELHLSRDDFVTGTGIAVVMATLFVLFSPGYALIVTFVPGVLFAWVIFTRFRRRARLPRGRSLLVLYFVTLAVQFLHFAEELRYGFPAKFPALYGGPPYSDELFVSANLVAYVIFAIAAVSALVKRVGFMLMPALFFVGYGAIGNVIAHTTWVVWFGDYFPGFYTAQAYWILGPLLLSRFLGSWRTTALLCVPFAVLLPSILILGLV